MDFHTRNAHDRHLACPCTLIRGIGMDYDKMKAFMEASHDESVVCHKPKAKNLARRTVARIRNIPRMRGKRRMATSKRS